MQRAWVNGHLAESDERDVLALDLPGQRSGDVGLAAEREMDVSAE